ncbi:LPS export ABC transporter permease LptG [Aurantimonas coralicida]|uniref:LPS export ABC transporter permease LptG n=1 Tax=Aurantimonas coralicida TaxID=182270 RepID=UPI001E48A607|nr:LPS export ABC transporter permease LptG [Aurantimonas coralicida]MCD1644212.1 LPS export ABC transporter permease LptG [Aurantimonas coralicida]
MRNWTLNRYFFRMYVVSFLSTLLTVFALIYLIDLIEVSRRSRFEDLGFGATALFSLLRVPSFIGQAFPFIVLFSSIYTLLTLNRRLELVVARASGVSIWQILLPFVVGSFLIGVVATFVYNPLTAYTKTLSEDMQTTMTAGGDVSSSDRVPWLRQEGDGVQSILGAKTVARSGTVLGDITAFVMNDEGIVKERIDAARAVLNDEYWLLEKPRVTRVGYRPEFPQEYKLPTSLRPEYVEQRIADPEAISIWQLGSKIDVAASLGFNTDAFRMQYHTLVAQPALFIAMTLLAATVATRFSRTGQSGRTIAGGVMAGFVLYVVTFLAKALGSNDVVPPVMAAWFPVLAAGLSGVTILLHQEDG